MRSREGKLEDYFKKQLTELGAQKLKWTSPGVAGVPDDIVIFLGRCWLVELKNDDGRLRPSQKNMFPKIAKNYPVYVLYGYDEVDRFIEEELIGWLSVSLSSGKICSVPSVPEKVCSLELIKLSLEKLGTSVKSAVTELQAHFTQNLRFFPSSKSSQLKRKSDS